MGFENNVYPEWSWSQSRDNIFKECLRKYYYQYYCGYNGWLETAPEINKSAYRLKQLTNLYLGFGEIVHSLIEDIIKYRLQKKEQFSSVVMAERIKKELNSLYRDSRNKNIWLQNVKKFHMLHEIYYNGMLPAKRVEIIKERIEPITNNFFSSITYKDLTSPGQIIQIEKLNDFYYANNKIYVKIDLLYRDKDNNFVVVDWKTGMENERSENQLQIYALYLANKYKNINIDNSSFRLEYLLNGECISNNISFEDMEKTKNNIIESIKKMKSYLLDKDNNIPKAEKQFIAKPEKHKCGECNYKEICNEKVL